MSAPYADSYNITFTEFGTEEISNQLIEAAPTIEASIMESLITPGANYSIDIRTVVRGVQSEPFNILASLGKQ